MSLQQGGSTCREQVKCHHAGHAPPLVMLQSVHQQALIGCDGHHLATDKMFLTDDSLSMCIQSSTKSNRQP